MRLKSDFGSSGSYAAHAEGAGRRQKFTIQAIARYASMVGTSATPSKCMNRMPKSWVLRVLLLVFAVQLYAPLVHAHPDGRALPGFAHLHADIPVTHVHDGSPANANSIESGQSDAESIGIADAIEPAALLIIAALLCVGWLMRNARRARKYAPSLHSRVPLTPDSPPPPSRAPPR